MRVLVVSAPLLGHLVAVPDRRIDAGALTRLVTDEGLAEAARKIAAEIAGMPLPEELVPELTALVHRGS